LGFSTFFTNYRKEVAEMKRVGVLVGREKSFPEALIASINERGSGEVLADFIELGGIRHDRIPAYDLIVDRISHEVPFYRAAMKRFALEGTKIINNPFWWSADDKFFNYSLAAKLGVAVPKTVLLPQKDYIEGITSESLRNLEFPLDWHGIIEYVGMPAILKPFDGGGWKNVSRVNSLEELWREYDQTGTLCMTLQEFIDFDQFVRCYCIGQEEVMIMPYDPRKPYLSGEQYIEDPNYLAPELAERVTGDVRKLCSALGYDINTVEFAIKDGIPYAIDFMNPAPDADLHSVGPFYHNWVTNAVTDLVLKRLNEPTPEVQNRWNSLLDGQGASQFPGNLLSAVTALAEQAGETILSAPVREAGEDLVTGVTSIASDAAGSVVEIIDSVTSRKKTSTKSKKDTPKKAATKRSTSKKTEPKGEPEPEI
jgi:glutathione synthase/RimK-type ligase-like ATP-grasp enzyme